VLNYGEQVDPMAVNHPVGGSSPSRGASFFNWLSFLITNYTIYFFD